VRRGRNAEAFMKYSKTPVTAQCERVQVFFLCGEDRYVDLCSAEVQRYANYG
jgi:hypothetical protein